jgi:hypothetical protein
MSATPKFFKPASSTLAELFATVVLLLLFVVPWFAGIAIARGFFSTLCALCPFYAWYLVVERATQLYF